MNVETAASNGDWVGVFIGLIALCSLVVIKQIVDSWRGKTSASHQAQSGFNGKQIAEIRELVTACKEGADTYQETATLANKELSNFMFVVREHLNENQIRVLTPLLQGIHDDISEIKTDSRRLTDISNAVDNCVDATKRLEHNGSAVRDLCHEIKSEVKK